MEPSDVPEEHPDTKATTPTPKKNPYDIFEEMCAEIGTDFAHSLAFYERWGYIFSGPDFLVMFEPHERLQTWLVFVAIGEGHIPTFLNCIPYWLPNFSFARILRANHKVKTYPMERVCRLHGIDPEPLKKRRKP